MAYEQDARAAQDFQELKEVVIKLAEEIDASLCRE